MALLKQKVLDVCPYCEGKGRIEFKSKDGRRVKVICAKCEGEGEVFVYRFNKKFQYRDN